MFLKNSKRPHFAITFAEPNYPLVGSLQLIIGGSFRHKKANHAYVLTLFLITSVHLGRSDFIISTTSPVKLNVLINYLDQFPLQTGKRLNYEDWKLVPYD